jgi:uncharacterized membrane-anchored protein YhcB (DUF1043 family)
MEVIELQVVQEPQNLHQLISERKVKDVRKFIDSYPNERVVVFNGNSAITMSLKCGYLDIYEILVTSGFKLAAGEDFAVVFKNIEANPKVKDAMKVKVKEIHRKYMKESTKKHLFKLNLMSKLTLTTPDDKQQEFESIIAATFEELDKIAEVEKFMKYVASARGESSVFIVASSAFSKNHHS